MTDILKKLTLEELRKLQEMFENNKEIIRDEINKRVEFTQNLDYTVFHKRDQFSNISSIKKQQCDQILGQITIKKLPFFEKNLFHEAGNNKNGALHLKKLLFYSDEVQQIIKDFEYSNDYYNFIRDKQLYYIFENPRVLELVQRVPYLIYLDTFFDREENILGYEGAFNTYLYIKNSICNFIDENQDVEKNMETIFIDSYEKQAFVENHFAEIASALLYERECIPNSRLSIYNNGLSRGSRKQKDSTQLTYSQKTFADAVAFGISLKELKQSNFEKIKQLIYIPNDQYKKLL